MKNIFHEKDVTVRCGTVALSTGGKKLPVTLSMKINKPRFTHENLRRLQVIKGDSDRGLEKFAQAVRHTFGRKSVEPGLAESLTVRNKSLSHWSVYHLYSIFQWMILDMGRCILALL